MNLLWLCQSEVSNGWCSNDTTLIQIQWCATNEGWTAFRIGPFRTVGGFSWTGLAAFLNTSYVPTCHDDRVHAFSAYILGNIDASNALLGYPPIHQHHFHFFGSGNFAQVSMNNHGDSQCHGGTRCYIKNGLPGYAWFLRNRIGLHTEFNDARLKGSSILTSWAFLAYKSQICLSGRPITQIRLTQIGVPLGGASRAAYDVLTALESVVWSSGSFVCSESDQRCNPLLTLIDAYFHSHAIMVHDIWLFQGNPDQVFSNLSAVTESFGSLHYGHGIIRDSVANVRTRALLPNPAVMACTYRSLPDENVGEGVYHRKSRCALNPSITNWVMIVFHQRQDPALIATTYPMHSVLRLYYAGPSDGKVILSKDTNAPLTLLKEYASYRFDFASMPKSLVSAVAHYWLPYKETNAGGEEFHLW